MKKKIGLFFMMLMLCLCLMGTDNTVYAASGSTSVSVSAGTVDIGGTVTVSVKASGPSGEKTVSTMTVSYDSSILQFVSCSATYGGGGSSVTATSDSFTVTLKAVAAGTSSISVSGSDGVVFDTNEELESMSGSGASVTVNNAAVAPPDNGGSSGGGGSNEGASNGGSTNGGAGTGGGSGDGSQSASLSADNSLKALTISPGTLSPQFSGKTTKYSAAVANDVTNIAVSATPVHEKAVVESVSGNNNLSVGNNTVKIVVKAENGVTATYTINVTRQGAGEEKKDDPKKVEETEKKEPETETETQEDKIVIGDKSYRIKEDFKAEEIPVDFTEAAVNYHGADYQGVSFEKGTLSMLYLAEDTAEDEAAGKFFIYDATRDSLYPFVKLSSNERYVIALLAPVDYVMPDTYLQTAVLADGTNSITAYQKYSEEDTELTSDFYVFYGVNDEGTEGWYQYDAAEGTYQRLSTAITGEETTASGTDMEYLQKEYEALSAQYTKEKSFARNMMAVLVFIAAVLLIIIVNMLVQKRRKNDDDHFPGGDDDDDDDSYLYEDDDSDAESSSVKKQGFFKRRFKETTEEEDALYDEEAEDLLEEKSSEKKWGFFQKRSEEEPLEDDDEYFEDEDWLDDDMPEEKAPKSKTPVKPLPKEGEEERERRLARESFFSETSAEESKEKKKEKPKKRIGAFSDDLEDELEDEPAGIQKTPAVKSKTVRTKDWDDESVQERKRDLGKKNPDKRENSGEEADTDKIEVLDLNDL